MEDQELVNDSFDFMKDTKEKAKESPKWTSCFSKQDVSTSDEFGDTQASDAPHAVRVSEALSRDAGFVIPCEPCGRRLVIDIKSVWGDPHYVGLAGIDIYDKYGQAVAFKDYTKSISAHPADINILAGYGKDPRTVDKLLDGINLTCDDLHVWLAPFTAGQSHEITITFDTEVTLGAIRLWNYNKSRIHSCRGARDVDIMLDSK